MRQHEPMLSKERQFCHGLSKRIVALTDGPTQIYVPVLVEQLDPIVETSTGRRRAHLLDLRNYDISSLQTLPLAIVLLILVGPFGCIGGV